MVRFKEIQLYPTEWFLDVWVTTEKEKPDYEPTPKTREVLAEAFVKRYGADYHYYHDWLGRINFVNCLIGTPKSEIGSHTRIIMVINPDLQILVHELQHVLWRLNSNTGLEIKYDSQEWQACMVDYLFSQIYPFNKIPKI